MLKFQAFDKFYVSFPLSADSKRLDSKPRLPVLIIETPDRLDLIGVTCVQILLSGQ